MPSGGNTGDGADMPSGDSDGNTGGGPGMPSGENTGDRPEMPSDGNKEDGAGDQQPGEDTGNVADDTADENETTGEDESETGESLIADRLNQKAIARSDDLLHDAGVGGGRRTHRCSDVHRSRSRGRLHRRRQTDTGSRGLFHG